MAGDRRTYLLEVLRVFALDINFLDSLVPSPAEEDGALPTPRPEQLGKALGPFGASADEAAASWPAYPHRVVLLRPELVALWYEDRILRASRAIIQRRAEAAAAAGETSVDTKEPITITIKELEAEAPLRLNPDLFVSARGTPADALQSPDGRTSIDIAEFLLGTVVPSIADELVAALPLDSLTTLCHSRGLNMRYLGALAHAIEARPSTDARADLAVVRRRGR